MRKKRKKRSAPSDSQSSSSNDQIQFTAPSSDPNVQITPTSTQYVVPTITQTSMPSAQTSTYIGPIESSSGELIDCINTDGTIATNCETGSGTNTGTDGDSDQSSEYISSSYTDWWDWYRESSSDASDSSYSYSTYYGSGSDYYGTGSTSMYDYYEDDWMAPKDKWQDRVERFLTAFQNESK